MAELEHGVFSYFLIRGLRGEAANPDDGVISLDSLEYYVSDHVRQWTGKRQTPQMMGDAKDFPLGVVRTPIPELPPVPQQRPINRIR